MYTRYCSDIAPRSLFFNNLSPDNLWPLLYLWSHARVSEMRDYVAAYCKIFHAHHLKLKVSKHPTSACLSPLSSYLLLFWKHPATTRQYIMHSICAALVYYKAVIILIILQQPVCHSSFPNQLFPNHDSKMSFCGLLLSSVRGTEHIEEMPYFCLFHEIAWNINDK